MDITSAVILGIVEGVTEFLPISSTGHLILASHLLGIEQSVFVKSFEIAIQLGAIAAAAFLYWRLFLRPDLLKRIAIAFIPTAIAGLVFYNAVKNLFLENEYVVLGALLLGGAALILFEIFHGEKEGSEEDLSKITYLQSLLIGCFQAVAIIPGVSRSAATIVGGLVLGVSRKSIVEFSFILAMPTMVAATSFDLLQNASAFGSADLRMLLVGFAVSFIVAIVSIKFLLYYVKNHTFISFGIYRILIAVLFFALVL